MSTRQLQTFSSNAIAGPMRFFRASGRSGLPASKAEHPLECHSGYGSFGSGTRWQLAADPLAQVRCRLNFLASRRVNFRDWEQRAGAVLVLPAWNLGPPVDPGRLHGYCAECWGVNICSTNPVPVRTRWQWLADDQSGRTVIWNNFTGWLLVVFRTERSGRLDGLGCPGRTGLGMAFGVRDMIPPIRGNLPRKVGFTVCTRSAAGLAKCLGTRCMSRVGDTGFEPVTSSV
jgi:hypothetical protein